MSAGGPRSSMTDRSPSPATDATIAIVVLTCGRLQLLRRCVERVLGRTSPATREIIICDNASTDGTAAFLATLTDPRIRVLRHERNIGQNAYRPAFALTSATHLVELDDDVVDAPIHWDAKLLAAFRALPRMGFLASGLVDDPRDTAAYLMHHVHRYSYVVENGHRLALGPVGGHCAITSREVYELVGGFRSDPRAFFLEDGSYAEAVLAAGYRTATLADLQVVHAGGPHFSAQPREKIDYYRSYRRRAARRAAVKRALLAIPGVAGLNRRCGWFVAPDEAVGGAHIAELFLAAPAAAGGAGSAACDDELPSLPAS
jgi:GT2 family glycosyltransferase